MATRVTWYLIHRPICRPHRARQQMVERQLSNLTIDEVFAAGPSITFRCLLSDAVTPPVTVKRVSTPNRAIPENDQAWASPIRSTSRSGDHFEHQGRRRYHAHVPRRPERHADDAMGHGDRTAPKGRGGNADDLKQVYDETSLPALSTLRGRNAQGRWQLMVRRPRPGRYRAPEPVVARVLDRRRGARTHRAEGVTGHEDPGCAARRHWCARS